MDNKVYKKIILTKSLRRVSRDNIMEVISPIRSSIKIDKNIPIPKTKVHYSVFPFSDMEVGDSFFVSKERFKKTNLISLKNFICYKAKEYVVEQFLDDKYSFHLDRANKGVRVFRIQ